MVGRLFEIPSNIINLTMYKNDQMPTANNKFLDLVTEIVYHHLSDEKFGVSDLAKEMGLSRVELYRKLKVSTKQSPSRFISELKLKKALELLKNEDGNVSEIAYRVGFGSPSYFTKCFREKFGYSPGEVQNGNHSLEEQETESATNKNRFWLAVMAVLLLVSSLAIYFLAFNKKPKETISIAVLPPKDISPEGSNCLILEGFREDLQSKLYSMNELQVVSGTTTDTYRNSDKTIQQIGKELGVDYIIEVRGQYVDPDNTIWVQLIDAKTDKHLWVETYNRGLENEKVHEIQQEIALSVASSLKINLSDEEIKIIEKLPTMNPVAYSYYRMGRNEFENFHINIYNSEAFFSAKSFFEKAIQQDSTFGDAYCELAEMYILTLANSVQHPETYNTMLDSGMSMANNALKHRTAFQHKTLLLQAQYYSKKGEDDKAMLQFEKLWEKRNKDYTYYFEKAAFNWEADDYFNCVKNVLLYLKLKPESLTPDLDRMIWLRLSLENTGFPKLFDEYNKLLLGEDSTLRNMSDSVGYLSRKAQMHLYSGEYKHAIEIRKKLYIKNQESSERIQLPALFTAYYFDRDFNNSFKYGQEYEKSFKSTFNTELRTVYLGSLYRYFGDEEKAQWHINGHFKNCQNSIQENLPMAQEKWIYGELAGIYSMQGDKTRALENLRIMASRKTIPNLMINSLERFLMYDNIRNEPEFKTIVQEMKVKYQAEHERIKKLLIQEGLTAE